MGPLLVLLNPHLEKWPVNHSYINVSIRTFQVKPYDTNLISTFCCYFFWQRHKCSLLIPMCDIRCLQNRDNLLWEHTMVCCCLSRSNLAFFFLLVKNNGTRNLQFVGSSWFLYRSWMFFERKARTTELFLSPCSRLKRCRENCSIPNLREMVDLEWM